MIYSHPLQRLGEVNGVYPLLWISVIVLTVILWLIPLKPNIISFEFNALKVLAHWKQESTRLWAAFSLGLDFLYIVVYSTLLTLLCLRFAENDFLPKLGFLLAWGQGLAAVFDVIENATLFNILLGSQNERIARTARLFATAKFVLIIAGILYVASGCILNIKNSL